jgi:hypothetical protein
MPLQITPLRNLDRAGAWATQDGRIVIERQRLLGRERWRLSATSSGDNEANEAACRAGLAWRTRSSALADLASATEQVVPAGRVRPLTRHKRSAWRSDDGLFILERGAERGWAVRFYSPQAYMAMPDARFARLLTERWPIWLLRHGLDQALPLAQAVERLQTAVEREPLDTLWRSV